MQTYAVFYCATVKSFESQRSVFMSTLDLFEEKKRKNIENVTNYIVYNKVADSNNFM